MTPIKIPTVTSLPVAGAAAPEGAEALQAAQLEGELDFAAALAEMDNAAEMGDVPAELVAKVAPQGAPQMAVQPVSLEQLNWSVESAPAQFEPKPQVLNHELIQQVNEAVNPAGDKQVMQMKDLLLQQGGGRSPAIDFAPAEVDPQLMNFDDFVAQKNAVTGKAVAPKAYGMPAKTGMQPMENIKNPEWSMESVAAGATAGAAATQLQQPAYSFEAPLPSTTPRLESASPRVFDMQQLNKLPQQDVDSILSQVSDYIVQAKVSKEPTVQMRVQHQDLGMLDIVVNRVSHDGVNIAIGAQDQATKLFLGQHRESLMTHLTQAGVAVNDLRMEQSSSSSSRDASSNQQQQGGHGQDRQFSSEQNQRRHEQQRREDLWQLLREKEVA